MRNIDQGPEDIFTDRQGDALDRIGITFLRHDDTHVWLGDPHAGPYQPIRIDYARHALDMAAVALRTDGDPSVAFDIFHAEL